jgi:transcriptional regulator with XRE-family HTH domain
MQLQEVALAAGMQPPQLSKIERGDTSPRWTTIERIVRALDVDLADLVVKEASSTKTRL